MICGITYSDESMSKSRDLCMQSMKQNGFDDVRGYDSSWWEAWEQVDTFYWMNKDTLSATRGCGYWLWKPWCIAEAMTRSEDGDTLVYSDAGVEWINNPQHIVDVMEQDIFLFNNGHRHAHWCKSDVMQAINGQQIPDTQEQVQASVIFIRVSEFSRKFIKEWLLWCQMPGFIDDSPSVLPNHPEFAEHRHDQAILTCLAIKYGIRLHWWPDAMWYESQRYRWPEDKYPSMVKHHRKRNNDWNV